MSVFSWFKGRYSERGKVMATYKRGIAKAKNRDHEGAINDYTTTIDTANAPPDLRAMALYNRALVYSAIGDDTKAIEDLNMVVTMGDPVQNVKVAAQQKLDRIKKRLGRGHAS